MSTNAAASEKVALDLPDLYENAPCGYHSIGPDGTILRMNRTELTWLGYAPRELVGKRRRGRQRGDGESGNTYELHDLSLACGVERATRGPGIRAQLSRDVTGK